MKHELTKIPGIGGNMADHLIKAGLVVPNTNQRAVRIWNCSPMQPGYPTIESLKGQDPEAVYMADCAAQGVAVDRCALYCYRWLCIMPIMAARCRPINKIGGIGRIDLDG